MSSSSRSNWTQYAKNASITKDFAQCMKQTAIRFTEQHDPVQCADCKTLIPAEESFKIVGSRDHLCADCESKYAE